MLSGGVVPDEELAVAEEKFEESKELAETAMFNLLSNDVEQITQMKAFVEACLEYHQQSAEILAALKITLDSQCVLTHLSQLSYSIVPFFYTALSYCHIHAVLMYYRAAAKLTV